jgi:hypothetical protein
MVDISQFKLNLKPGEVDARDTKDRHNLSHGDMVRVNRELVLPNNEGDIVDIETGDVGLVETTTARGAYVLLLRQGKTLWLWDIYFEPVTPCYD